MFGRIAPTHGSVAIDRVAGRDSDAEPIREVPTMKHKPLHEQVAVVGGSTGIGRATALAACTAGTRVVTSARGQQAQDSLTVEARPGEIVVRVADVAEGSGSPDYRPSPTRSCARRSTVPVGTGASQQLLPQRVRPELMVSLSRATAFRPRRSEESKSPTDSNNLRAPVAGDDRARGVVAHRSR